MKKTEIDIADLMPESIIQDIRNRLDLYIKGLEATSNKPIAYQIKFGTIIFEIDMKRINTKADFIKSSVLEYFNCFGNEIYRKGKGSRKKEIVYPRQVTIYELLRYTRLSLSEIGREIGGHDHSTILHAKKTIINLRDVDKTVQYDLGKIEQIIDKKLMGL